MTATAAPKVKDHELVSFGLVESASVNSFADFIPSDLHQSKMDPEKGKRTEDFVNTFICHLIFYFVFCFSLVLHILIDLGLGSFLKNNLVKLFGLRMKSVSENRPSFA